MYKFNLYLIERKNEDNNELEKSYVDYQSNVNENTQPTNMNILDSIEETNSCKSSKVEKSAVDLLDNVFEHYFKF